MNADMILAAMQWMLALAGGLLLLLSTAVVFSGADAPEVTWEYTAADGSVYTVRSLSAEEPASALEIYAGASALLMPLIFFGLSAVLFCLRRIGDYLRRLPVGAGGAVEEDAP